MSIKDHKSQEQIIDWINVNCDKKETFHAIGNWATVLIKRSIDKNPGENPGVMYMLVPANILFNDSVEQVTLGYQFLLSIPMDEGRAEQHQCFLTLNAEGKINGIRHEQDVFSWLPAEDEDARG